MRTLVVGLGPAAVVWLALRRAAPRRGVARKACGVKQTTASISGRRLHGWYRCLGRRMAVRSRERRMSGAVVELTDLISVVVGSGGTIGDGLRLAGESGPLPLRPGLLLFESRLRAGLPLSVTLLMLSDELGERYRPLVAALLATERDGAPLSLLLARLSDEARQVRRQQAESRARALPVQLLFPIVLCALPAVLIGAVVPLVVVSVGRL